MSGFTRSLRVISTSKDGPSSTDLITLHWTLQARISLCRRPLKKLGELIMFNIRFGMDIDSLQGITSRRMELAKEMY